MRRSRAGVVSVAVVGSLSAGRVGDEKMNVCEPLLTHRKNKTVASKPGFVRCPRDEDALGDEMHPEPGGGLRAGLVVPGV